MSLNSQTARMVDPVLSAVALMYKHPERVGHVLFPKVPVNNRGGQVIEFDRRSFRLLNSRRAPGADTQNVQFGYEGKPFYLVQEALNAVVPREHVSEAAMPGVDIMGGAVEMVMNNLTLSLEFEQAKLATDADNYSADKKRTLGVADQFSNPDSDPETIIDEAKEQTRLRTGSDPNVMVLAKPGFRALKRHPKITERFKYTSSDSITADMLAALFDLERIAVGRSVMLESDEEGAPFVDVWGNHAVLAYAPQRETGKSGGSTATMNEPSFGYTYTLKGHPVVEKPEYDGVSKKSWYCGVTYERVPVLCGADSGFLLSDVTATA